MRLLLKAQQTYLLAFEKVSGGSLCEKAANYLSDVIIKENERFQRLYQKLCNYDGIHVKIFPGMWRCISLITELVQISR